MENHRILSAALQKYYSALKSLNEFGQQGDFFDDISNLDKFFSEFRNITFVIQKELQTDENKQIYRSLCERFLSGDALKWFKDTRNKITKESPFQLKKELIITLYLPMGTFILKDDRFIVDIDSAFENATNFIRMLLFEELCLKEVFFSSQIVFREADETVELYPKIIDGINQMQKFIEEIQKKFPCECEICNKLSNKIEKLLLHVQVKEIQFTHDYVWESGADISAGQEMGIYFSMENSQYTPLSSKRSSLDNPIYKECKNCIRDLFFKFILLHVSIFQMQEHDIMPVFMLIYNDETYRIVPFSATTKTTFYRKVSEILELPDFEEVSAVFLCVEQYYYEAEQLDNIHNISYSKRINFAKGEQLLFSMLTRNNREMEVIFDESKIDDMNYVAKQIENATWSNTDNVSCIDWRNPIRHKLNDHN